MSESGSALIQLTAFECPLRHKMGRLGQHGQTDFAIKDGELSPLRECIASSQTKKGDPATN